MARASVSEVAAMRFRELASTRGLKKRVANRLGFSPSAITPYVDGSRVMDLTMLEAIAEETGIPAGELVTPRGDEYRQLNADEAALVRALRLWPASVRQCLVAFVAFFANEPTVDLGARNLAQYYREFDTAERRILLGAAEQIRRAPVTPDSLEQLERRVEAGATRAAIRTKRGRREP